jgi:AmmeMemoRadiSam system protein B
MLRLPAVSGRFYPSSPEELTALVQQYSQPEPKISSANVKACLVPHAGYVYSGHVAGAVFARIKLPKKILVLGVRHHPRGERAAINSTGAWRTPLGDVPIDTPLAAQLCAACPLLREDDVAHATEHSLEVQLPFLQVLAPQFTFVPVALGTIRFEEWIEIGNAIGKVLAASPHDVLLVTTSDLNHYEDDATTRVKDAKAIDRLLQMDACGLYGTCRDAQISMCGLGPAVAMLTALHTIGSQDVELVRYATSGDISRERDAVVGYAGMIFS